MRLLITRSTGDAQAAAAELQAGGHEVLSCPLIAVTKTNDPKPNLAAIQAFMVTDADGARALADAVGVRTFPVFCESPGTAAELERLGFKDARSAGGDASAMARAIERALTPKLGGIVYVCSTSAPVNLTAMLSNMGFAVRTSALYEVRRADALPQTLADALQSDALDAAVFFSADEARAFTHLVQRAELESKTERLMAIVAAPVVAAPLTVLKFAKVVTAPRSDALSLIAFATDALLPQPEPEAIAEPAPEPIPEPFVEPIAEPAPEPQPEQDVITEAEEKAEAPEAEAAPEPEPASPVNEARSVDEPISDAAPSDEVVTPDTVDEHNPPTEPAVQKTSMFAALGAFFKRLKAEKPEAEKSETEEIAPSEDATSEAATPEAEASEIPEPIIVTGLETVPATLPEEQGDPGPDVAEPEDGAATEDLSNTMPPEPLVVSGLEAVPAVLPEEPAALSDAEAEIEAARPDDPPPQEPVVTSGLETVPVETFAPETSTESNEALQPKSAASEVIDVAVTAAPAPRESIFKKFATFMSRYRAQDSPQQAAEPPATDEAPVREPAEALTETVPTPAPVADPPAAETPAPEKVEAEEILPDETPDDIVEVASTPEPVVLPEPEVEPEPEPESSIPETLPEPVLESRSEPIGEEPQPYDATAPESIIETSASEPQTDVPQKQNFWSRAAGFFRRAEKPVTTADEDVAPPPVQSPDLGKNEPPPIESAAPETAPPVPHFLMIPEATEPETIETPEPISAPKPEIAELEITTEITSEITAENAENAEIAPEDPAPEATAPPRVSESLHFSTEKSPTEESPLGTMPPTSSPPVSDAQPERLANPRPEDMLREDVQREDRVTSEMAPRLDQSNTTGDEKPTETMRSRTGGRSARLQAEDAADARALNQRFKFGGGEPAESEQGAESTAAASRAQQRRAGAGAVPLIVGLVVVGGIAYYTSNWWMPLFAGAPAPTAVTATPSTPPVATSGTPTPAPSDASASLQARTDALAADVVALNQRMAAVEQRAPSGGDSAALTALTQRVAALEKAGSTVDTTAPEGLSTSVTNQARQLASVTARVATLEAALGNVAKLEDLAMRLSALEGKSAEANSVLALGDRLAALEKRDAVAATALVLATAQLRDAVQGGRSYTVELETVAQLAKRADIAFDADALRGAAANGLIQSDTLRATFPSVATKIVRAGALPDNSTGWVRRVLDRVYSILSVRPFGTLEGDSVGAIVARAEQALKNANPAQAVTELEALQGPAREAAQPWLDQAKAMLTAQSAIDALAAQSVGAMSAITRTQAPGNTSPQPQKTEQAAP